MSQSESDQKRREGQSSDDQQQSAIDAIDFSPGFEARSDVTNNHNTTTNKKKRKKNKNSLECKHCEREFQTLQALGGHQTAHKREREAEKRLKIGRALKTTAVSPNLEALEVDDHPLKYNNNNSSYYYFIPLHGMSGFPVAGFMRPYNMAGGPTIAWVPQRSTLPETRSFRDAFPDRTINNSHDDDKGQISGSSSVTDLDLTLKL